MLHSSDEGWCCQCALPSAVGSGAFKGPPKRPAHITEADRTAADIKYVLPCASALAPPSLLFLTCPRLDDNTRLVFQLDILTSEEKTERVCSVPCGAAISWFHVTIFPPARPSEHSQWIWAVQKCFCPCHISDSVLAQERCELTASYVALR